VQGQPLDVIYYDAIVAYLREAWQMAARTWAKRTGWGIVIAIGLAIAAVVVVIGPMDATVHDAENHVVRLAWDDAAHRLVINEPVREPLALDGPYVRRRADGGFEVMRTVARGGRWHPETILLPSQAQPPVIEVGVDNPARTHFQAALRDAATPMSATTTAMPERLLLLSDMEGEFDKFVALLQTQGVLDAALHWRYGTGHVVLAGDFVDRGENVLPLLWLIYRLEDEAARAGGRVHYVLGNHELRNLYGSFKDVPRRIFASRDAFFGGDNRRVFGADTVLGQWLRAHHVIEQIGDILVTHGGISGEFLAADLGVDEANAIARRELDVRGDRLSERAQPMIGPNGVAWYRGMARPEEAAETDPTAHLDAVLGRYGVSRIAIGHTLVPHAGIERGGKLLRLNVLHAEQLPEALLMEGGRVLRVDAAGGRHALQ